MLLSRAREQVNVALKAIESEAATPLEYAYTISNKASCLWNLPDAPENPDGDNLANLTEALE